MPKVLVDSENLFLYEYPVGKRYITDLNKQLKQSAQKGTTCTLYSSLFGARYGNKIEELRPLLARNQEDRALSSLVQKRDMEKVISQFRKDYNHLEDQKRELSKYKDVFDQNQKMFKDCYKERLKSEGTPEDSSKYSAANIRQVFVSWYISYLEERALQEGWKEGNALLNDDLIGLVKKFGEHNEFEWFSNFLNAFWTVAERDLYLNLLKKLNAEYLVDNILLDKASIERKFCITINSSTNSILMKAAIQAVERARDFVASQWDPLDGVEGLMHTLKNENSPLRVGGDFGKSYYNVPPSFKEKLYGYDVYSWNEDEFKKLKDLPDAGHSIVIIGAEKEGRIGYVFFVDPNDESAPNQPRKIYKISYDAFLIHLVDNAGYNRRSHSDTSALTKCGFLRKPFALITDDSSIEKEAEKYKSVLSRLC